MMLRRGRSTGHSRSTRLCSGRIILGLFVSLLFLVVINIQQLLLTSSKGRSKSPAIVSPEAQLPDRGGGATGLTNEDARREHIRRSAGELSAFSSSSYGDAPGNTSSRRAAVHGADKRLASPLFFIDVKVPEDCPVWRGVTGDYKRRVSSSLRGGSWDFPRSNANLNVFDDCRTPLRRRFSVSFVGSVNDAEEEAGLSWQEIDALRAEIQKQRDALMDELKVQLMCRIAGVSIEERSEDDVNLWKEMVGEEHSSAAEGGVTKVFLHPLRHHHVLREQRRRQEAYGETSSGSGAAGLTPDGEERVSADSMFDLHKLSVTKNGIFIWAKERRGVAYAVSTLLTTFLHQHEAPHEDSSKLKKSRATKATLPPLSSPPADMLLRMPQVVLLDQQPSEFSFACGGHETFDSAYTSFRGLLVDVARNFVELDDLIDIMSVMALLKLNVLHLHLTDDQGWRVDVAGFPELTRIGARRGKNSNPSSSKYHTLPIQDDVVMHRQSDNDDASLNSSRSSSSNQSTGQDTAASTRKAKPATLLQGDNKRRYYSADDVKRMRLIARLLHIVIIPEFDVPAHSAALIRAASWARKQHQANSAHRKKDSLDTPQQDDLSKLDGIVEVHEGCVEDATQCVTDAQDLVTVCAPDLAVNCMGGAHGLLLPTFGTVAVLRKILGVVVSSMFPDAPYIHLGGDESQQFSTATSTSITPLQRRDLQRMWGSTSVEDAHHAMLRLLRDELAQQGRTLALWDDAAEGLARSSGQAVRKTDRTRHRVDRPALFTWWRDWHPSRRWESLLSTPDSILRREDALVVLSPTSNTYFDASQHPNRRDDLYVVQDGLVDVAAVWRLRRLLGNSTNTRVIGIQGCLWSETVTNRSVLWYQLLPRALVLAQVAWTYPPHHPNRAMKQQDNDPAREGVLSAASSRMDGSDDTFVSSERNEVVGLATRWNEFARPVLEALLHVQLSSIEDTIE